MGKDRDKGLRGSNYNPASGDKLGGSQSSGFIGFSAFASNLTNATDPDYYQVDPEYRVLLKKLQKKDSISRIKGLEELNSIFVKINIESSEFNVSSISPLMNAWEFMYKRLVNDDDRHVRDLASTCLGSIGSRIGKNLAPHIKSLLGPWLFAICDQSQKEQSNNTALLSFNTIFPEKKRKDVLKFGHDEALTYLCENLQETPQTIGDSKSINQDILQERYERCISNSLLAIEYLINNTTTTTDDQSNSSGGTTTTSTGNTEIYEKIFEAQFFSFFQSKSSNIRKTAYRVLATIIKKVPGYVDKNFKDFSSKVLGLFSEKDSSTHLYMWDAIISFLKSYNDKAWNNVDVRKHVLPRLWAFLRSGCYGSVELSYPSILPLLTFIPNTVIIGTNTTSTDIGFFKEFFSNLEKGLEVIDITRSYGNPNNIDRPSNLLLSCYLECLIYSSKKWGQQYQVINNYLIDNLLLNFYNNYFTLESCSFSEKLFIEKLLETTNKISNISIENKQKIDNLFTNSEILNNIFKEKQIQQQQQQEESTTTTPNEKSISNETLFSRLNLFLLSIVNGGSANNNNSFTQEFIKNLFSLSCDNLKNNQDFSIKIIALILKNYKINQIFKNSIEIQSFLNDTIISTLKEDTSSSSSSSSSSLIPIIVSLLSSINNNGDTEIVKESWSNILKVIKNNYNYLSILTNEASENLDRKQLLSNSILDSIIISNGSSSGNSYETIYKDNVNFIKSLLFNNNNNEYSPIISNESIEIIINWVLNQLIELMETIEMNLLLEFNIDYLVDLSIIIFSINDDSRDSIKKLLIQWTRFNIEINHRSNLISAFSNTCKPIEKYLYLTRSSCSNSVLSILIDYINNNNSIDPNLDYLSNCAIRLIENNGDDTYSYLITKFMSNPSVVNSISQIKISWFRYNKITPFYLLNDNSSNSGDSDTDQLFKILVFNFKVIEHFGFDKFVSISIFNENIKLLLLNLIFINGDNNLPVVGNELGEDKSSVTQIKNYVEFNALNSINQYIKSIFKYYITKDGDESLLYKSTWFNDILNNIGNSSNGGVYLIALKLIVDNIVNSPKLLLDTIENIIPNNGDEIKFIKQLNLVQVLLPILPKDLIESYKIWSIEKISNLSSSIPTSFIPISIQLSLISSIIIQKQEDLIYSNSSNNNYQLILTEKEWLILLNSIQMIQQWNSRMKSQVLKQQDPNLELTFFKEIEISLCNYLLLIIQYVSSSNSSGGDGKSLIYLSNNQSLLVQSLLSIWLSSNHSLLLDVSSPQYNNLIEYQSLKIFNQIITGDNIKFIIPGVGDQFQIDSSILVLNNWLNNVSNKQLSSDSSYILELYSNTFEKMSNDVKFKISLTRLDQLLDLVVNGLNKNIQKTAYTILESYFIDNSTQLIKSFLLEDGDNSDRGEEKVNYIIFSSVFEKLLLDFELTWKLMKKNKNSQKINSRSMGQLMLWNLLLKNYSRLDLQRRSIINGWLNDNNVITILLNNIFNFINKDEQPNYEYNQFPFGDCDLITYNQIQQLCSHCLFSLVNYLPNMVRRWADDNSTNSKMNQLIQNYIIRFISPIIIQNEISRVNSYREPVSSDPNSENNNFQVKGSNSSREVTASYEKDEMTISLVLSIPETYPLRVLTVEFSKRIGVSESQWRQWLLSMTSLLLTQDGTVLDACLLWKNSLDKHFQGVEVCPICYSMFHNGTIPKFQCKTCKNKFHAGCIFKWFTTSHKSNCPLCQTNLA